MASRANDPLTSAQARRDFLQFFSEREHRAVPSAPVFPQDDPTLLFTNAGMNQFKDVFLGTGSREYSRAVDTQKCIRVQGKHNDLEEVGVDTYHHTFFEMLGNWSFGDYFKREAITWAWELLTDVWKLPKERLWVTVFCGDEADGLPVDEEAARFWREHTDIDPEHVLLFDKKDNFWEMGETGPCGPCTEIHIDRGGPDSDPNVGKDPELGVNAGNERFIELWNLVFIQYNRKDDGSLVELPAKHVDTGMGFERILAVLQGKLSNYDTDLFAPIFAALTERTGKAYGAGDDAIDIAFRVCADHVRAVTSALADGALPSNEGRGYVLRRLIRRASRYGLQTLGLQDPFLFELAPAVAEVLGDAFPEMPARLDHIQLVVRSEEESFRKTLERGIVQFDKLAGAMKAGSTLDGREAYELYATFGFPQDLVELMARERGLELDGEGWEAARLAHSEISKSEGKFRQLLSAEELGAVQGALQANGFEAETVSTYHKDGEASVRVDSRLAYLKTGDAKGANSIAVLSVSPFYPEAGGQVGDTGRILDSDGNVLMTVEDTQKLGGLVMHVGTWQPAVVPSVRDSAQTVSAEVDVARRNAVRANHTATHLMHRALREVLGDHVTQQGSYVGSDYLRFDFSNPGGVAPEDLARVEALVNTAIFGNAPLETTVENPADAKARGVMALFGEKYGDRVRVVDVGGWSTELCGGTHVSAAGDIGPFVILSERAIQAGVRRIEALTQERALEYIQAQRALLADAAARLKTKPDEVPERIAALQTQLKEAKKKSKQAAGADVASELDSLRSALEDIGGVQTGVVDAPSLTGSDVRDLADRVKGFAPDLAVAIFGREGAKVPYIVVCQGRALEAGLKAGDLARGLKDSLGGGGGGRPEVAQGQGARPDAVPGAIEALRETIAGALR